MASPALRRWHRRWLLALDRCADLADRPDVCEARAPAVSGWSVGQQLEHLWRADTRILESIEQLAAAQEADEPAEGGGPTLLGHVILVTGFIPRGRAQAPASTTPTGLAPAELKSRLGALRDRAAALEPSLATLESVRATSPHPILGRFDPRTWVRFCGVHHAHHGRIVRDILEAAGVR